MQTFWTGFEKRAFDKQHAIRAGIGATVGGIGGALAGRKIDSEHKTRGGLIGGAVGALTGGVVGSKVSKAVNAKRMGAVSENAAKEMSALHREGAQAQRMLSNPKYDGLEDMHARMTLKDHPVRANGVRARASKAMDDIKNRIF